MVILNRKTLNRKAAEQNPASTAALRRVAINLSSQRRALRHPGEVDSIVWVPTHAEVIAQR